MGEWTQENNEPGMKSSGNNGQYTSTGTTALVLGILALLCLGLLTGIPAIIVGSKNTDPAQQGSATAGKVLGWISVGTSILGLIMIVTIFGSAAAVAY